jgi:hypothetical protein
VRWSSGSAGRRTVHAKFGVEQSPFDLCHTHRSPRSGALSTLSARHLRREQQEACREELSLPLSLPLSLSLSHGLSFFRSLVTLGRSQLSAERWWDAAQPARIDFLITKLPQVTNNLGIAIKLSSIYRLKAR